MWSVVNRKSTCPVCGKGDRCKVAKDSNAVRCFRIADESNTEWRMTRPHANGATYQRRRQVPCEQSTKPIAKSTPRPEALTARQLDHAYSLLLGKFDLTTSHRLNLRHRSLSDERIVECGFRTMPMPSSRGKIAAQ